MNRTLTLDYPETLPDMLNETQSQFENEAKMALAVKLYEMKKISSGIAALLAGIDRVTFLLNLSSYSVPMIDIEDDDLLKDSMCIGQ